jgi:hypothetical protein
MLARYAPDLIQGEHSASRRCAFKEHLLRLAGYIERDAKILGSETWHEHDATLQARIDVLEAHCALLEAKLNVAPLRWLRYLARQARTLIRGG